VKTRMRLYTRFERLWHWVQAALIVVLIITGMEMHGSLGLLGFEKAHGMHLLSSWPLLILTAFAIFWHLTTGAWKQYIPRLKNIGPVAYYYLLGIFRGRAHPFHKSGAQKLNPLQALAYFMLKTVMLPLSLGSGLCAAFPDRALQLFGVRFETIALLHTAGAFALLSFLIVHTYLTTTGGTLFAYIKAMITGWEEAD